MTPERREALLACFRDGVAPQPPATEEELFMLQARMAFEALRGPCIHCGARDLTSGTVTPIGAIDFVVTCDACVAMHGEPKKEVDA